jgi:hypothetical protein
MIHLSRCVAVLACTAIGLSMLLSTPALAGPLPEPFIEIDLSTHHLDFGSLSGIGVHDMGATLTIDIVTNLPLGGIVAELSPLAHRRGAAIGPERVWAKSAWMTQYESFEHPVDLTGPLMPGCERVNVQFRLMIEITDTPGNYSGVLTLTYSLNSCWEGPHGRWRWKHPHRRGDRDRDRDRDTDDRPGDRRRKRQRHGDD